jgi:hypothetical protein
MIVRQSSGSLLEYAFRVGTRAGPTQSTLGGGHRETYLEY